MTDMVFGLTYDGIAKEASARPQTRVLAPAGTAVAGSRSAEELADRERHGKCDVHSEQT
jgi:hypothetical protein